MSVLIDVADGVRDKWATVSALETAIPVSRVYYGENPASSTLPYATINCEESRDRQYSQPASSGDTFICWVRLTVSVYATGFVATFKPAMAAVVTGLFNQFTIDNSTHMACFVSKESVTTDGMRDAEVVYRGDVIFDLMLGRSIP